MLEQKIFSQLEGFQDLASRLIVEELYRLDVTQYAVAPGARMLPLLKAINQHPKTKIKLFNDERQLAFWAKSFAKISKQPVVLLVTSGTAVGNLLPGVMEAFHDQAPLLVITCDRPWELQTSRANQTVQQENFFSRFSKFNLNLPPLTEEFAISPLLANLDQLIATAKSLPAGPVHLNIAFRKPYTQENFDLTQLSLDGQKELNCWASRKRPLRTFVRQQPVPDLSSLDQLINDLNLSHKTLIIAGPQTPLNAEGLNKLAEKIKSPILADIDSGLRGRSAGLSLYNLYLKKLTTEKDPDLILYFGDRIISEELRIYLAKQDCPKYLFTEFNLRQDAIENEFINFDYHFFVNLAEYTKALEYKLPRKEALKYQELWRELEEQESQRLNQELLKNYHEATALYWTVKSFQEGSLIYHSSSLIFRELEYFGEIQKKNIVVQSNRGCVGIDGVLSSALGACEASQKKTYLLIGDQALTHDLTALAQVPANNFHIILVNNYGGAVFNLLNQGTLTPLLINSQNFDYASISSAFKLDYNKVQGMSELLERLNYINQNTESTFTEIVTDGTEASDYFRQC